MAWRKPELKTIEKIEIKPDAQPAVPKKTIVPEFIKIDKMSIRYIQPYPAPKFIEFFQELKHEDADFVRIPIDKKLDALYLRKSINKLLQSLTGMHWDRIEKLINDYNKDTTSSERTALLNIMDIAKYFATKDNIEFLTEP